ncbi:hypothetical protein GCM10009827_030450 [Dactylosporangium maewongense]|uniref:DUF1152 domain-containing protein n=2 Tax=Dactylosporangium maewongense TaxID=634393 RepID=A0ABP4L4W3_9ACTN
MSLAVPPLFAALAGARSVLVAGAGGGFDVYAGLPLALALRAQGKVGLASRVLYLDTLEDTVSMEQVVARIGQFRAGVTPRPARPFPH